MKLYATTTNEKGKQEGMGGEESITINVNKGNRRMCEFYITLETIDNKEFMAIDMLNLSDGSTTRVYEYDWLLKGKSQKGGCEHDIVRDDYGREYCQECGKYNVLS